jgi:hypothetical protein
MYLEFMVVTWKSNHTNNFSHAIKDNEMLTIDDETKYINY